jgi:hypothetical protein
MSFPFSDHDTRFTSCHGVKTLLMLLRQRLVSSLFQKADHGWHSANPANPDRSVTHTKPPCLLHFRVTGPLTLRSWATASQLLWHCIWTHPPPPVLAPTHSSRAVLCCFSMGLLSWKCITVRMVCSLVVVAVRPYTTLNVTRVPLERYECS